MTSDAVVSVVELANQYKNEFENSLSELIKRAETFAISTNKARIYQQINLVHHKLLKKYDEMVEKIQDTQSALSDLDTTKLMKAFSWMSVMLLGLSFGAFLGGVLFSSLLGFLISGSDAALLAYIVLPLSTYYFLHLPMETTKKDDLFRRHMLFLFAAFEGLLTGYIFSDTNLIGAPPIAALTPIAIGLIPHFASPIIGEDHAKLIFSTIGGGLFLHLSLGAIIDLSLPYLLLVGIYGFIGFAILQLYLNNFGKDPTITHMYQFTFVCAVIFSQALIYIIFGFDVKELSGTVTHSTIPFL